MERSFKITGGRDLGRWFQVFWKLHTFSNKGGWFFRVASKGLGELNAFPPVFPKKDRTNSVGIYFLDFDSIQQEPDLAFRAKFLRYLFLAGDFD